MHSSCHVFKLFPVFTSVGEVIWVSIKLLEFKIAHVASSKSLANTINVHLEILFADTWWVNFPDQQQTCYESKEYLVLELEVIFKASQAIILLGAEIVGNSLVCVE